MGKNRTLRAGVGGLYSLTVITVLWYHEAVKGKDDNRSGRFVMALLVGCVAGACVGVAMRDFLRPAALDAPPEDSASVVFPAAPSAARLAEWESSPAGQYVAAYQNLNWGAVIAQTLWMQDRLAFVMLGGDGGAEDAREAMEAGLAERTEEGNQLRPEGIEDQYVITPFAAIEAIGSDAGHEDLERPAAGRVWFRAVYPTRVRAPRSPENLAIRSLVFGVNYTEDGYILKANIRGNLDILWDRISLEWDSEIGE